MTPRTRPDLAAIPAYVPGRTFPGAIKLASNETTHGPLPSVRDAVNAALDSANRYPDNGALELRSALAQFLEVAPESVACGCGSVTLCQELVQATCAEGDEVIFAWRSFEAYPVVTQVAGAVAVKVPLTADQAHDLDAMAAAVTDRTRLIFVCNPNNPTGRSLGRDELERFLDAVPEHVVVALDEAYYEYNRSGVDGIEYARSRPNVVVLRTFSKAYGLAGVRVGYAVGDPAVIAALGKVHLPFSVSSLAQAAAIASLGAVDELLARTDAVVAERGRVRAALIAAGYDVPDTEANFVYLPLGEHTAAYTEAGAEAGVLLRGYGTDGVRITIGDPHENDAFLSFATSADVRAVAGVGVSA
ncbi:histidinol-phosphate transaminase [Rhodococcus triatomae]|uniref:histidinol-phosphate transaminase n=1 Tax=Rhodococcus triatomae TaxID=300028 RepID=UPI000932BB88|nr:histidinol-phosphate transaminase [Rhodococcus triatomae]QNG20957.1 histidinol-phosphate transaminase [Rhodococcus triatomae]QNG23128.1 histidinol-phosphate transaminase [Rhodococcus triatomae]